MVGSQNKATVSIILCDAASKLSATPSSSHAVRPRYVLDGLYVSVRSGLRES